MPSPVGLAIVQEVKPSPRRPTPAALGAFFTKIEVFADDA